MNEKFSWAVCFVLAFLAVIAPTSAFAIEPAPDEVPVTVPTAPPSTEPEVEPVATQPVPTRPPLVDNEFIPEERDLTDCIGVLERPGCGSESRGGWRQLAVLGALFVGLAVVFGNVIRGVRKNRSTS